jgi:hypothetical protein
VATYTLVASDYGETGILTGLVKALPPEHTYHFFAGEGKHPFPYSDDIIEASIRASDKVVITISDQTRKRTLGRHTCESITARS